MCIRDRRNSIEVSDEELESFFEDRGYASAVIDRVIMHMSHGGCVIYDKDTAPKSDREKVQPILFTYHKEKTKHKIES